MAPGSRWPALAPGFQSRLATRPWAGPRPGCLLRGLRFGHRLFRPSREPGRRPCRAGLASLGVILHWAAAARPTEKRDDRQRLTDPDHALASQCGFPAQEGPAQFAPFAPPLERLADP